MVETAKRILGHLHGDDIPANAVRQMIRAIETDNFSSSLQTIGSDDPELPQQIGKITVTLHDAVPARKLGEVSNRLHRSFERIETNDLPWDWNIIAYHDQQKTEPVTMHFTVNANSTDFSVTCPAEMIANPRPLIPMLQRIAASLEETPLISKQERREVRNGGWLSERPDKRMEEKLALEVLDQLIAGVTMEKADYQLGYLFRQPAGDIVSWHADASVIERIRGDFSQISVPLTRALPDAFLTDVGDILAQALDYVDDNTLPEYWQNSKDDPDQDSPLLPHFIYRIQDGEAPRLTFVCPSELANNRENLLKVLNHARENIGLSQKLGMAV